MNAILGLTLTVEISKELNTFHAVFWSDRVDVLWWLHSVSRQFKPFIANRVAEIQDSSSSKQCRYIHTDSTYNTYIFRNNRFYKLQ